MTSSGTMVVRYSYDAWGNILSITGTLANSLGKNNPFRYRSYYYDNETGWYYLKSRYYDPAICRFISPDSQLFAGSGADGLNLYAYCGNNPLTCIINKFISNSMYNSVSKFSKKTSNIKKNTENNNYSIQSVNKSIPQSGNTVLMINSSTSLIENTLVGGLIGNITLTTTVQYNDANWLYSYSNIGNETSSKGIGINISNWYGTNAYISNNLGIGGSWQITPYITWGSEISIRDGISYSGGFISGDVTNEISINIGWGTVAGIVIISAAGPVAVVAAAVSIFSYIF